jgi:hypothetical protein
MLLWLFALFVLFVLIVSFLLTTLHLPPPDRLALRCAIL